MTKERLTITLDNKLLKKIDKTIDGATIRNRSHAIEYFLRKSVLPKSTKVLILAGGEGVQFKPFTDELPKSLLPVAGKPLLAYTLEALRDQGFKHTYISVGHLGDKIKKHFGTGEKMGLKIKYIEQSKSKTGTAQPLKQAEKYFSSEPFLLVYADVLTELSFSDLIEFHTSRDCTATMALASVEKPSEWGVASVEGSRVIKFVERPRKKTKSHLINAGIYALSPEIFKSISASARRLEKDLFPKMAESGKICAYPFDSNWYDVSSPAVYEQVLKQLKK